ncbi:MAG: excinuclease ABC subunit UvrB [Candidatus Pacebacteria bacterium]|nr:excinuclease ABC subunit UvrB [Candidatus Paceibacterota bacterium]
MTFRLESPYKPSGDQPEAISSLLRGLYKGEHKQTLLGVTGSGKTFTMANVIQEIGKPTLVIAHNKTLAAQLAQEFKEFFPHNAVHYFVSYYDYYQPEAYIAASDTYIEKDAQINEEIDRLRHASTQSLLSRSDVIIVASVSCIYGLGSPEEYFERNFLLKQGDHLSKIDIMKKLVDIHFERTPADLKPGAFRSTSNSLDIMPVDSDEFYYHVNLSGGAIEKITRVQAISGIYQEELLEALIFPAKHFLTNENQKERALKQIKEELDERLAFFQSQDKYLEYDRLKRRTEYDMAMIREVGYCSGIENYSRHLSGKKEGEAPDTLLSYFPKKENGEPDFLTIIDESHVTLPQIRAMFRGDRARKENLIEHGFRLPSAKDNRPLRFEEFEERVGQQIYVSATPSSYEREVSESVVEQIIRPTGLLDPVVELRPVEVIEESSYPGQIQDFIQSSEEEIQKGGRVLATTLTKKMAEDLTLYLKERNIKAEYLHSDIKTIERIKIITDFRKGLFDILIGVNLLREGLDMPEVSLIGILDADKVGFLRSETALVQTIGRAARNENGKVIVYADKLTDALDAAMKETKRRRILQEQYNKDHNITPKTIQKNIKDITEQLQSEHSKAVSSELKIDISTFSGNIKKLLKHKKKEMSEAVKDLDFERAAIVRDQIFQLEEQEKQK